MVCGVFPGPKHFTINRREEEEGKEIVAETLTIYEDAVAEYNDFPFRSRFHEILEELQEMRISSSTPIRMKNLLYDLKFLLAECVMLEGREKERITQTKKSLVGYQYVKKKWILFLTKRKLVSIQENLLKYLHDVNVNVAGETERPLSLTLVRVSQRADFPEFDDTSIHGFEHHFEKILWLHCQVFDRSSHLEAGGKCNPQDEVNALRKFSVGEIKINALRRRRPNQTKPSVETTQSFKERFSIKGRRPGKGICY
ncbi:unnamed protein product [Camellia sinensis]